MNRNRGTISLCQWLILLTTLLVALSVKQAFAEEHVYHSKLVSIHYNDARLLQEFERKIRPTAFTRTLNKIFLGQAGISEEATLGELVDTLFRRVQLILDMPQPDLRVHIRLLADQDEVSRVCSQVAGKFIKAPAFYYQKTNTIYLQTRKVSKGILAHEMGHAVVDHYFVIRPPSKIAEMLSQYVDREISEQPL
ncbi:MAG: hypothetical protein JRJ12_12230 [Deltaproteobacteria bacterium]|nr:hypothetical protein [Deltaproteobacteria bacterium]MBW2073105.1 hypothetical protein [Deltaproteobacteria bacterium]